MYTETADFLQISDDGETWTNAVSTYELIFTFVRKAEPKAAGVL